MPRAEEIVLRGRRLADLDLNYLEPRIRELAKALGRPDITDLWEGWKREA